MFVLSKRDLTYLRCILERVEKVILFSHQKKTEEGKDILDTDDAKP